MKTIVFFCIPAHGHTNPTLGVVQELINRGHRVIYYSYDMLREKIMATGAEFVSCDDYDLERRLEPKEAARLGNDLVLSMKVLVDTTLALDKKVCRDIERLKPDCIVADSMAVWGKAVALKLGIPFVSSVTTFAFNRYSAKIIPRLPTDILKMMLAMPRANHHVRRLKKQGYPIRNVLEIIGNDNITHTVVYTSAQFQPCAETFSKEYYCFAGPSVRPAESTVEKTGKKLLYISMGTVNNALLPLYKTCIHAFRNTDFQVIISVGKQVDLEKLGRLPENVRVYPVVDQIAVLQKSDVFLTHCGMNSVTEALYHGVPLVMLPKTQEQKGVACRVSQLGAGTMLQSESADAILAAVRQVIDDPSYARKATEIAQVFRKCSGAAGAADKILEQCQ